jgi:hypothetical protein
VVSRKRDIKYKKEKKPDDKILYFYFGRLKGLPLKIRKCLREDFLKYFSGFYQLYVTLKFTKKTVTAERFKYGMIKFTIHTKLQ